MLKNHPGRKLSNMSTVAKLPVGVKFAWVFSIFHNDHVIINKESRHYELKRRKERLLLLKLGIFWVGLS